MSSPDSHSSTDSVLDLPATTRPSINVKEAKVNRGDISPTAYYKIRCVPDPKAPRALQFKPLTRVLKDGDVLRIARFAENSDAGLTAANALDLDRLVFKTRVVSRTHAEVWMEDRTMFIKDIGSSSGTFLNGKRLSPAEEESEAWPLCDGDLVQLGVEYCGGILDVHKPARMRVELCETTSPSCDAFRCSSLYNSSLSLSDYDSVLNLVATVKPAAKDQCDESPKWIDYHTCSWVLPLYRIYETYPP
ncbi:hypothetical protein F5I97DRAFT_63007 [Phlebopus sp. FC_14]|nr:hypothetical protein F5I97DRAFT_63007 [Phlebopus sp. FC_14]